MDETQDVRAATGVPVPRPEAVATQDEPAFIREADAELATVDDLNPAERIEVFQRVHARLQAALSDVVS